MVGQTLEPPGNSVGAFALLAFLEEERLAPGALMVRAPRCEALLTYVREGELSWSAPAGRSGLLRATEFQRRPGATPAEHHEVNASRAEWAQLFRIGLQVAPGHVDDQEQRRFSVAERRGGLCVVASPDGRSASLRLGPDALVFSAILNPGQHVVHALGSARAAWLHVVQGAITFGEAVLETGDGAGAWAERAVSFTARQPTEVLLIDLASPGAGASK